MFDIQRKRVRNYRLRVDNTGQFKVTVPFRAKDHQIAEFLQSNRNWISKQQRYFQDIYDLLPDLQFQEGSQFLYFGQYFRISHNPTILSDAQIYIPNKGLKKFLKQKLSDYLEQRLEYYCLRYGFQFNQLRIKDISSTWGSCSAKNNLNFNYHLVFLEPKVIDYLIVHELAHLKHKNHGKRYWQLVATLMPDFKTRQQKLKKLSQLIFCWGTKISRIDQKVVKAKVPICAFQQS